MVLDLNLPCWTALCFLNKMRLRNSYLLLLKFLLSSSHFADGSPVFEG